MTTIKELKAKINHNFKQISATPPEIICIYKDHVIIKYEERDFETGCATKDYLYTLVDYDGNQITPISYCDVELCKRVINMGDVKNLDKIQAIVNAYNLEKAYIRHAV